jgi:hypothetical protein
MIDGDPIFVIEPHGDDAFLSLGWSIHEWVREGQRVDVVTVFTSERTRVSETQRWAESIGANWQGLGHEQRDTYGSEGTKEVVDLPAPLLPEPMMSASACRIWPLAFENPDHAAVAACAPEGDLRYIDTPYQLALDHQPKLREALIGRTIEWWLLPPQAKWDGVRFFESQAHGLRWFPPKLLAAVPEVIVR